MQPQGVSMIKSWQMTLWWMYNGKDYHLYAYLADWSFGYVHKASFSLTLLKIVFIFKDWHHRMKPMSTTTIVSLAKILLLENLMLRFLHPSLSSCSKLSITGDTAKYLVFDSAEFVHFHLKTQLTQKSYAQGVHYGKERIETRSFRSKSSTQWRDPFHLQFCYICLSSPG